MGLKRGIKNMFYRLFYPEYNSCWELMERESKYKAEREEYEIYKYNTNTLHICNGGFYIAQCIVDNKLRKYIGGIKEDNIVFTNEFVEFKGVKHALFYIQDINGLWEFQKEKGMVFVYSKPKSFNEDLRIEYIRSKNS